MNTHMKYGKVLRPQFVWALGCLLTFSAVAGNVYYVDANFGNDDNLGTSPGAGGAMKTLSKVLSTAKADGDVVHAAPGDYDELTQTDSAVGSSVPARGIVRSGVTLIADEGPEVTRIIGKGPDTVEETLTYAIGGVERSRTIGSGGVRCLEVCWKGRVVGFTIAGGTARGTGADADKMGGGVYGYGHVENCIISNNAAYAGGVATGNMAFFNCRFYENCAKLEAGVLNACCACNCLFDRNYVGTAGRRITSGTQPLLNCTFGPDNVLGPNNVGGSLTYLTSADCMVYNCVFLGTTNDKCGTVYNSAFLNNKTWVKSDFGWTDCVWTNAAALKIDAECRPKNKSSLLVDQGKAVYDEVVKTKFPWALNPEKDLNGVSRVAGAGIDIGCFEYRPRGLMVKIR